MPGPGICEDGSGLILDAVGRPVFGGPYVDAVHYPGMRIRHFPTSTEYVWDRRGDFNGGMHAEPEHLSCDCSGYLWVANSSNVSPISGLTLPPIDLSLSMYRVSNNNGSTINKEWEVDWNPTTNVTPFVGATGPLEWAWEPDSLRTYKAFFNAFALTYNVYSCGELPPDGEGNVQKLCRWDTILEIKDFFTGQTRSKGNIGYGILAGNVFCVKNSFGYVYPQGGDGPGSPTNALVIYGFETVAPCASAPILSGHSLFQLAGSASFGHWSEQTSPDDLAEGILYNSYSYYKDGPPDPQRATEIFSTGGKESEAFYNRLQWQEKDIPDREEDFQSLPWPGTPEYEILGFNSEHCGKIYTATTGPRKGPRGDGFWRYKPGAGVAFDEWAFLQADLRRPGDSQHPDDDDFTGGQGIYVVHDTWAGGSGVNGCDGCGPGGSPPPQASCCLDSNGKSLLRIRWQWRTDYEDLLLECVPSGSNFWNLHNIGGFKSPDCWRNTGPPDNDVEVCYPGLLEVYWVPESQISNCDWEPFSAVPSLPPCPDDCIIDPIDSVYIGPPVTGAPQNFVCKYTRLNSNRLAWQGCVGYRYLVEWHIPISYFLQPGVEWCLWTIITARSVQGCQSQLFVPFGPTTQPSSGIGCSEPEHVDNYVGPGIWNSFNKVCSNVDFTPLCWWWPEWPDPGPPSRELIQIPCDDPRFNI